MKIATPLCLTARLLLLPLVLVTLLGTSARGQTTFAQFTQDNNTEPFTFSNTSETFSGTTTGNLTFLTPGAPAGAHAATISLSSSAITPATTVGPFLFQPMDGATNILSFTRVGDGANLLTLTFTGTFSGFDGDFSATLSGNSATGNTVVYTSDFLDFSGTTSRTFGLTAGPDPDYSQGMNGFLNDFSTDLGGSFSGVGSIAAVPEPSTWAAGVLVAGAIAVVAFRRRKVLA